MERARGASRRAGGTVVRYSTLLFICSPFLSPLLLLFETLLLRLRQLYLSNPCTNEIHTLEDCYVPRKKQMHLSRGIHVPPGSKIDQNEPSL